MTKAEFDAVCAAVIATGLLRNFDVPAGWVQIGRVNLFGSPGCAFWLNGQRIRRRLAIDALVAPVSR